MTKVAVTGILLSGSDGANSLGRIKEVGGATLAQDPQDAKVDTMPPMVVGIGLVDFVLPVAAMPPALITYWRRAADDSERGNGATGRRAARNLRHAACANRARL
ncbi:MAG: hypothetical protein M3R24_41055 [Chloroflexota bacterium]|nr:hypothetical protein [Chloroflexota bacterium]